MTENIYYYCWRCQNFKTKISCLKCLRITIFSKLKIPKLFKGKENNLKE